MAYNLVGFTFRTPFLVHIKVADPGVTEKDLDVQMRQ